MVATLVFLCLLLTAIALAALWSCRRSRVALAAVDRQAQELQASSRHCPVTGLANRTCAEEWLGHEFAEPDARPAVISASFVPFAPNLDREAALVDRIECVVAHLVAEGCLLARTGPGQYLLALANVQSTAELVSTARAVCTKFGALVSEVERLRIGVSIAVGSDTPETLVARSLQALDTATGGAPVSLTFTDPELEGVVAERALRTEELARAIDEGRIVPFFQPIVELGAGRILGFEVLARWRADDGPMRMPGEFLPLAEEAGLVGPMYYSLLEAAAAEVRSWPSDWNVALNISRNQLADGELIERTMRILRDSCVGPERLELEISEQALCAEPEAAREIVDGFRRRGVRITLDNFGSGNLHLRDLARFAFDRIKVDPAVLSGGREEDVAMALGLVAAAGRHLGVPVLVQGIETHAGAETAQVNGCAIGQGYLFGRPGRKTECFRLDGALARSCHRAA